MVEIIEKLRQNADAHVRKHAKKCFEAIDGVSDAEAEGFAAMLATAEIVAQADSKHLAKKGEPPGLTCVLSERSPRALGTKNARCLNMSFSKALWLSTPQVRNLSGRLDSRSTAWKLVVIVP
jgi:hypothetical protein